MINSVSYIISIDGVHCMCHKNSGFTTISRPGSYLANKVDIASTETPDKLMFFVHYIFDWQDFQTAKQKHFNQCFTKPQKSCLPSYRLATGSHNYTCFVWLLVINANTTKQCLKTALRPATFFLFAFFLIALHGQHQIYVSIIELDLRPFLLVSCMFQIND